MNREEILERSRSENRNHDEMELAALAKAGQRACAVGGLVCGIIIVIEAVLAKNVSCGIWAVYLSMTGTMLLTKYSRLRKKHELVFGLIQLALAATFLVMHIVRLVR